MGEKYLGEKSVGEKSFGENRDRWDAGFRFPPSQVILVSNRGNWSLAGNLHLLLQMV